MREVFNTFHHTSKPTTVETATASAEKENEKGEVAVANAMSNVDPSTCPKCGVKMGTAFLFDRRPVYYCDPCRVTHPTE